MFKRILLLLFIFSALSLSAQVSIMTVTDETKHSSKEDFYHTFEYTIMPVNGMQGSKCQATRIGKRWFATAAHCVAKLCKKSCTIRMDLLEQPTSSFAEVTHTKKNPAIFIHPDYSDDKFVENDFALIRLDFRRSKRTYYKRGNNVVMLISKEQFNEFLAKNRKAKSQYAHALSPTIPPIAEFDSGNYVLDRNISVISIFDGKREVKPDPNPVYYVKDLGFCYTKNFGVRKGMSGSGVMTNTGELIGIIAGNLEMSRMRNGKAQQQDWFMFPVFNNSFILFMRDTMGSDFDQLDRKDAYPYLVRKTRQNFTPIIKMIKSINSAD